MKKSLIRILALALSLVLLCGCAGGGETTTTPPATTAPQTNPPETTAPPETGTVDGLVYFNPDRNATRTPTATGFYAIQLAGGAGKISYLVANEAAMKKIDSMDYMGLAFNTKGLIVDAVPLSELELTLSDATVTLDSITGNTGTAGTTQLTFAADYKAYDMSAATNPGGLTQLRAQDVLKVVQDKTGAIKAAFVTSRYVKKTLCPHCNEEVAFVDWSNSSSLPNKVEGHYILITDVDVSGQFNMASGTSVVLDLNGHTITSSNTESRVIAMFYEEVYFGVMDTSEGQTGKIQSVGENLHDGSCVWVRYGTFDLFSGTLDASMAMSGRNGTAVSVNVGATFHMHGGTIIGGTNMVSDYTRPDGTLTTLGGFGGSVYVGGTMTMSGGEIKNGTSVGRKDGEEFVAGGYGGNIYVSSTGTFEMTGGTIHGGKADRGEQDVQVHEKGTFTQTGGTIGTPAAS